MSESILTATLDPTAPTCERCGVKVHDPCATAAQQETCQLPADCYPDGRRKGHTALAWDKSAQTLITVDPNPLCGWCSDGVFVQGNKASIEAVIAAFHSHGQIEELKRNLRHWREECGKLHAKLSTIADIAEGSGTVNSLPHIAKIARGSSAA